MTPDLKYYYYKLSRLIITLKHHVKFSPIDPQVHFKKTASLYIDNTLQPSNGFLIKRCKLYSGLIFIDKIRIRP